MPRASRSVDPIAQIARSLDLLVKFKVEELKKEKSQREMIQSLFELGVPSGEIASLLGISRTTVDPELSKLRASKNGKKKKTTARKVDR